MVKDWHPTEPGSEHQAMMVARQLVATHPCAHWFAIGNMWQGKSGIYARFFGPPTSAASSVIDWGVGEVGKNGSIGRAILLAAWGAVEGENND